MVRIMEMVWIVDGLINGTDSGWMVWIVYGLMNGMDSVWINEWYG